jgi:hypothetical protein
LYIYI